MVADLTFTPTPFLPFPGQPTMLFAFWLKIFNNYLVPINATGDDWPDARKLAMLLHCLGTEGQTIFDTLPDSGTMFAKAVTALQRHLILAINVVVDRHKFRQRAQRPDESIADYVSAMKELLVNCDIGYRGDEILRDQLVEKASCSRAK